MKVLPNEQQKLILEFIEGDILVDELTEVPGPIPVDTPSLLIALLESAVASKNAKEAEAALGIAHGFKNHKAFGLIAVPVLLALLAMEEHYWHEDIVGILQRIRDARAVEGLFKTALFYHSYLEHNENSGLARKCTWALALADFGNIESYHKLKLLTAHPNIHLAGYAEKRLDSWEKEQSRKAFHFLP